MANCIDLKEHFGDHYRTFYEDSYAAERGDKGRTHDPWLLTVACRHGHIYPHGGTMLGASTNSRGPIANRLAAPPCVRVVQEGDDGVNVVFDVGDFDQVAAVMRPRRRRKLTPEQRTERLANGCSSTSFAPQATTLAATVDAMRAWWPTPRSPVAPMRYRSLASEATLPSVRAGPPTLCPRPSPGDPSPSKFLPHPPLDQADRDLFISPM